MKVENELLMLLKADNKDRILSRILMRGTKCKIIKDNNGEAVAHLEITEVV